MKVFIELASGDSALRIMQLQGSTEVQDNFNGLFLEGSFYKITNQTQVIVSKYNYCVKYPFVVDDYFPVYPETTILICLQAKRMEEDAGHSQLM
jgi:hypothetical protein